MRLWNKYLDGDPDALKLLLAYNREDVVNLKYLMEFAYQKMVRSLSFPRLKKTENLI